ncbi:MAG: hypothetical protein QM817_24250 [Archangium sp.]
MLTALVLSLLAADCAECHKEQAASFYKSRHATAGVEPVYTVSYANAQSPWCQECHRPIGKMPGLICLSCHRVPGGKDKKAIRGPHEPKLAAAADRHPITVEPNLGTVACVFCHEFKAPFLINEEPWVKPSSLPMQRTPSEMKEWSATAKCTQCHDPHQSKGAHDLPTLRSALRFDVRAVPGGTDVEVQAVGTGHRFPTGDVFRRLTIDVCDDAACTKKKGQARVGVEVGYRQGVWAPDFATTLADGEKRVFHLPPAKFWRSQFFFGNVDFEPQLTGKDVAVDVASGAVAGTE